MKISLIIPCYNEEANIQKGVLDRIANFVMAHPIFTEVLIVDDGSTDSTKNLIKRDYLSKFKQLKLIENNHRGKAYAVITGIKNAKEQYVVFSDIDLATPLEESSKLIDEIKNGYDIVIGSRSTTRKGAPILRKIMAVGFIVIRNMVLGLKKIRDTQCGFKLFKTDVAMDVIQRMKLFDRKDEVKGSSVSAAFDLEFLFLANKIGNKIKEVPVTWRHVETKNVTFIHDVLETLRDIAKIKWNDLTGKYN